MEAVETASNMEEVETVGFEPKGYGLEEIQWSYFANPLLRKLSGTAGPEPAGAVTQIC